MGAAFGGALGDGSGSGCCASARRRQHGGEAAGRRKQQDGPASTLRRPQLALQLSLLLLAASLRGGRASILIGQAQEQRAGTTLPASSQQHLADKADRRALLGVAACPPQCATGACQRVGTSAVAGFACSACVNGFAVTASGGCACPAGTYPTGAPVSCVACPTGSYCAGGTAAAGSGITACGSGLTTAGPGSATQGSCVTLPGYAYVNATLGVPCDDHSYNEGLNRQPTCTSCAGGFVTASGGDPSARASPGACRLAPGYFIYGGFQAALCPTGTFKEGLGSTNSCTPCARGVTTAGAGQTSAGACAYLMRGFEAATVDVDGRVTEARLCRQGAYCPGDVAAPGYVSCDGGMWTRTLGAVSAGECAVPPGHYRPSGGQVTPCADGTYKQGWGPAEACAACGDGINSTAGSSVTTFNAADGTNSTLAVRGAQSDCFVPAGAGMYQVSGGGGGSGSTVYVGRVCDLSGRTCTPQTVNGTVLATECGTYRPTNTTDLTVAPCLWCITKVGDTATATLSGADTSASGGFTACTPV